jgi:hypothetical protein
MPSHLITDEIEVIGGTKHHSDGGYTLYQVKAKRGAEAFELFEEAIGSGSCHCEHDCCGCTFTFPPTIIHHDRIYGFFILKQTWGINC